MRSRLCSFRTPLVTVLSGWLLTTPPVAAQPTPLGEVDLPPSAVVVDLSEATVSIVSSEVSDPVLRWWRERPDSTGSAELQAFQEGGAIVVERPELGEGEAAARLRIEIIIPPDQGVAVFGGGLDLRVERHRTAEEVENAEVLSLEPPDPAALQPVNVPPGIELQIVSSQVDLEGVGAINATFDGCAVEALATIGDHELVVRDSRFRLMGHRGALGIRGEGAEITAEQVTGPISVKGTGGSVELRSSQSQIKLELADATLQILDSSGGGFIVLTESNADLRDANFKSINIKSVESHLSMAGVSGIKTIDFTGGSLTGDSISGEVSGTVRDGARVDLTGNHGNVKLNLQQDSSATLRDIAGDLAINANGAEVSAEQIRNLTFIGDRSWATLTAIDKLTSFRVTRSEVDVDLSQCRDRKLNLAIQAESTVRVTLGTPCRVHAKGVGSGLASQVDVIGCELQLGRGGRYATRKIRGVDGKRPFTLTASVAENAELFVQGR